MTRRGACSVCGLEVALLPDGTVRNHYRRDADGSIIERFRGSPGFSAPAWCTGTRKPPASTPPAPALGDPVDEDELLLGLVEVIDGTFQGGADAVAALQHALPLREWLLARFDIRERADGDGDG